MKSISEIREFTLLIRAAEVSATVRVTPADA
jgi:hypothetical protein